MVNVINSPVLKSKHFGRKATLWLALVLLLVAFGLRVYKLDAADLTYDETASAFLANRSVANILSYVRTAIREHPPLYYLALHLWVQFAGISEYALRFFSVWFGVLSIALTFRVGRRGLGKLAALAAAAILTVQPFHHYYSQDARMYTLVMVEGLLLFMIFHRLRYDGRLRWWLAFGALAAASVFTHYFSVFILIAINLYALTTPFARSFIVRWFGAQVTAGGLFAVYIFTSHAAYHLRGQFTDYKPLALMTRWGPIQRMTNDLLWGVQAHPWQTWTWAVIALIIVGLILSVAARPHRQLYRAQRGSWGGWLLPIYLLAPLALALVTPERLNARYSAAIIPAYGLTVGLAIAWLGRKFWPAGLVAFGLLTAANINLLQINRSIIKSEYGHVISYLNAHVRPGDAIVFNGPWQKIMQLYYPANPSIPAFWLPTEPLPLDPVVTRQKLAEIAAEFDRVWVLPAALDDVDPQRVVLGWLTEHAYHSGNYKEMELYTIVRTGQPEIIENTNVSFGGVFALRRVEVVQNRVTAGEPILVNMPLLVLEPPAGDLAIALQVVDQSDNIWTRGALRPGNEFHPPWQWQSGDTLEAHYGLVVPPGTPPGRYRLRIGALLYPSEAILWPTQAGVRLPVPYIEVGDWQVLPCLDCSPVTAEGTGMTPLDLVFGNELRLVGYHLGGYEFWQGRPLTVRLLWRPEQPLQDDYRLRLELLDRGGHTVAITDSWPVANWYPTSQWIPGQALVDWQTLMIPPRQAPGRYTLRIRMLKGNTPLSITGTRTESILGLERRISLEGTWFDLAQITIRPPERTFHAGKISHPLSATLGDSIRLLGYDWDGPPTPGQNVRLVLYWQALREMDTPYTVFTHIIGPNETLVGQKDSWPRNGDYPTTLWVKGEVIRDEYLIPVSRQLPAGEYRLQIGLYHTETHERLPAVQNGQRALNDIIILERWER